METSADTVLGKELVMVWSLLVEVWNTLMAVWEAEGCKIDPYGGCVPNTPSSDAGCKIDPFGGCSS
jgi:hypothetical protein